MSDEDEKNGNGHSGSGDNPGQGGNGGNSGHGGGDGGNSGHGGGDGGNSGHGGGDGGNSGHGGGGGGNPGNNKVTILVDNVQKRVRAGQWIVSELKLEVGVDPAKILAEITPNGLKDLDDSGTVTVREGSRFMSHARTGGSS